MPGVEEQVAEVDAKILELLEQREQLLGVENTCVVGLYERRPRPEVTIVDWFTLGQPVMGTVWKELTYPQRYMSALLNYWCRAVGHWSASVLQAAVDGNTPIEAARWH